MTLRKVVIGVGGAGLALAALLLAITGCGSPGAPDGGVSGNTKKHDQPTPPGPSALDRKIESARAKLDPADRALVDEQDYCPIMPKKRLGSMGVPFKVLVKGQPVFLCCKGCRSTAEDEPDETLKATLELKARNKK